MCVAAMNLRCTNDAWEPASGEADDYAVSATKP